VLGSLLGAVFAVLVVFVIPRITTVEDFGYWRMFLLYAGYVGFFHLGFGEGALLSWAGKSLGEFHAELLPSLKFLIAQHAALLIPGCALAILLLPPHLRFVAVAVIAYGVLLNTATLLVCALQAARRFGPVAAVTAAPAGVFLTLAALSALRAKPDYRLLIVYYFLAWLTMLGFLWHKVRPFQSACETSGWAIGKKYLLIGWPITLSNTAVIIAQSSDRFVLSSAVSIYDFAQYSLAASTMMVPITIIAAVARAFFPHLAAADKEQHPEIFGQVSRLILLAWSVLLPYCFAVDSFVRHFLPTYIPGLSIARILLLGVLFFAGVQILHGSIFNLYGKQKHFLFYSLLALSIALSLAAIGARVFHSLTLVAAMQVLTIGLWWLFNTWSLRRLTGESWHDFARVIIMFAWSAISLWIAFLWLSSWAIRTVSYWALITGPLLWTCADELRLVLRFAKLGIQHFRGLPTVTSSTAEI
jgi:O-antigen/teichoic acid export membrane protein